MEAYKHSTGTFSADNGLDIFYQSWAAYKSRAALVVIHGLGEHSGRYETLLAALAGKNISLFIADVRGFGRSGGKRGCIERFRDYVSDVRMFIAQIKSKCHTAPLFMLGHSFGGIIAMQYVLAYNDSVSGLVLSSPALDFGSSAPAFLRGAARLISGIVPNATIAARGDFAGISRNMDYVESCRRDKLLHGRISARLYTEASKAAEDCMRRAYEITTPMLIVHGKADTIADYRKSEVLFERLSSQDKNIRLFDGLYHQTFNEIPDDRDKVLAAVQEWFAEHI